MNPEAKKVLDKILKKEIHELTLSDRAILRSRLPYLKASKRKYYKEVLSISKAEKKMIKEAEERKVELIEEEADEANRLAHPAEKDEGRIPYKELQKKAEKLNLKFVGIKREKLIESIEKAEKPKKKKK